MNTLSRIARYLALIGWSVLVACGGSPRSELDPVPCPTDLSKVDQAIREQLVGLQAALDAALAEPDLADESVARAFGDLGMAYQAYKFNDAARIAYTNASILNPGDMRWWHYRGYVEMELGEHGAAGSSLARAYALEPTYLATSVWLGENALRAQDFDAAEGHFREVMRHRPNSAAVLLGLGRITIERGDYRAAIDYLERGLVQQPEATEIHYQLGVAYRGVGDRARAVEHLARVPDQLARKVRTRVHDPLLRAVRSLDLGSREHEGLRAAGRGDYRLAVVEFRQVLLDHPERHDIRHNLGLALLRLGRRDQGIAELEAVLEADPGHAPTHLLLGRLMLDARQLEAAEYHLRAAVAADPDLVAGHMALADLMRISGRHEDALEGYRMAESIDPSSIETRIGLSLSLLSVGRSAEAADRLEDDVAVFPDDSRMAMLLARMLAVPPEGRSPDPERAEALARRAFDTLPTVNSVESVAMAIAAADRFDEAARWQRLALQVVSGDPETERRIKGRLALYERGEPCARPWELEEEITPIRIPIIPDSVEAPPAASDHPRG